MNSSACCEFCGSVNNLLRCGRCRSVVYCSKDHQLKHWKKHKSVCKEPVADDRLDKDISSSDRAARCTPQDVVIGGVAPRKNRVKLAGETDGAEKSADKWALEWGAQGASTITYEGSSESEILNARTETLSPALEYSDANRDMSLQKPSFHSASNGFGLKDFSDISLTGDRTFPPFLHRSNRDEEGVIEETSGDQAVIDDMCRIVIRDMDQFGVCVVDNFLGYKRGMSVLDEVTGMYTKGVFKDGQLVSNKVKNDLKTIRGDQITWIDGKDDSCKNIGMLISQVDSIILRANKMANNGKIGRYNINGRTKAMVACYPGHGTHYVKHVDNPNRDGRCITAIYYLNRDWNIQQNGGLLRIFPEGWQDKVADIEPFFDRILFFWSDRRNPHEVQPAFKTRYAITLWYFDSSERQEACRRHQVEAQSTVSNNASLTRGATGDC
ncbi:egl nine homolog 1 isoform X1 [Frankliniella occidentalis]|uniref:hypoxia-inducible factor-proline dioxygenase n=2 Tax=Frankliniella occidentalis TaxID=133901 RepID=A0A6J1SY92_FRAOC|nr:egl nine homolog 1 isoform X1 [Frankliniella occidentalis]